jgi:hypothetical protein
MLQSLSQSRIQDPILTALAYGIGIQDFVGHLIAPMVPVRKRAARIVTFGTNREKVLYTTRRSPGSDILEIETTYGDTPIELYQDALSAKLPIELDEESEGIVDLQEDAIRLVKMGLGNRLEADIFALVNNFAGYPATNRIALTAATQISNPAVNAVSIFDAANQAVLAGINKLPNTIIYGGLKAFNACKENPRIRDQIKYTDSSTINLAMLNGILGYPTGAISLASYVLPENQSVSIPFFDNSIWVGYVPGNGESTSNPYNTSSTLNPLTTANKRIPSWAYTYTRMAASIGGGTETGLVFDKPEWVSGKRTWKFPAVIDRLPVVTGMAAGYLITNVSA